MRFKWVDVREYFQCDGCGAKLSFNKTFDKVQRLDDDRFGFFKEECKEKARESGWQLGSKDVCGKCRSVLLQLGTEDQNFRNLLIDAEYLHCDARAKLAAAAPDLVRALLLTEWRRSWEGDTLDSCRACERFRYQGHTADCETDLALKKAGVR
jgi:hypothetical protein